MIEMRSERTNIFAKTGTGIVVTANLLLAVQFVDAAQVESFGSFVTTGTDASAGVYRMQATLDVASSPDQASSASYSSRSGRAVTFNNAPALNQSQVALTGCPDAIQTFSSASLVSATGATDADGDPLVFRISPNHGILKQDGQMVANADLNGTRAATWTPPAPVGPLGVLLTGTVSDDAGAAAAPLVFRGRFVPIIDLPSRPIILASAAGAANISMITDGSPPMHHSWYKDGVPLPGVDSAHLFLGPINRLSSGNYTMMVTNAYGQTLSSNVFLKVVVPQQVSLREANPGGGIRFSFGDFNGNPLNETNLSEFKIQWSANLSIWRDLTNATIVVQNGKVVVEDGGAIGPRFYRVLSQ